MFTGFPSAGGFRSRVPRHGYDSHDYVILRCCHIRCRRLFSGDVSIFLHYAFIKTREQKNKERHHVDFSVGVRVWDFWSLCLYLFAGVYRSDGVQAVQLKFRLKIRHFIVSDLCVFAKNVVEWAYVN